MDGRQLHLEEVGRMTGLLLEGELGPDDRRRLEQTLLTDSAALEYYQDYLDVHCLLHWQHGLPEERTGDREQGTGDRVRDAGISEFGDLEIWRFGDFRIGDSGFGVGDSGFGIRNFNVPNLQISKSPNLQIPPLSPLPFPLSPFSVGGPVFSYIAATLILGVMLLGAWAYKISHDYRDFAQDNSRGSTTPGFSTPQPPTPLFVARVTGMKDCRWSDPATATFAGAYAPLGRKYSLSSGLMEITYLSGAKVILEGPCSYEIESDRGGFLALGKLTAKVEERSEVRGRRSEDNSLRLLPDSGNPKSQIPNPKSQISLSPLHSPLFTVRTPTAVVTDLGTEFGVEVSDSGETVSHVFQGRVVVRAEGPAASDPRGLAASATSDAGQITLTAGQSARVEKDVNTGAARIATGERAGPPPQFVRRIVSPVRELDLLDIVAGGNGSGRRRERGIDPTSGMEDTMFVADYRTSDRRFHSVGWQKMIDGVFMPDGRDGVVRVDSAGDEFDGFPLTDGRVFGSIWARAADVGTVREKILKSWTYTMTNSEQFMRERRGLLVFYANAGMTFDLAAVRKQHSELPLVEFRALAGLADGEHSNPEDFGQVDLWVLVDGHIKYKREKLRVSDGVVELKVKLAPGDRFLTLAATDGGNGIGLDCVVFGDPVLETMPKSKRKEDQSSNDDLTE